MMKGKLGVKNTELTDKNRCARRHHVQDLLDLVKMKVFTTEGGPPGFSKVSMDANAGSTNSLNILKANAIPSLVGTCQETYDINLTCVDV